VNDNRPFPLTEAVLRALVPLLAMAAMAVFAAREPAPACDEGAYLALLAGAALLTAAFLAPAPAWEAGVGAALATGVVWGLPAGPGRGAALSLLLMAILAVAAARRLAACLPGLPLAAAMPLALGAQVLLRGNLLLHPQASLRTLVALLALPVAAGTATALLARRHGAGRALLAGGTALVLAPGWNVAATLGLIALAAGDQLGRTDMGRISSRIRQFAALLALLAPIAWEPRSGLVAAVAGLALWRPRIALGASVPLAAGLAWAGLNGHGPAPEPLAGIGLLALLVPSLIHPDPERAWNVPTALVLAAAAPWTPDVSALAAPLALAALSPRGEKAILSVQGVWTGALLGGTALLAGYPWLRAEPLTAALSLAGLAPGWISGAVVVVGFALLTVFCAKFLPSPGGATALVIVLAAFLHLPPAGQPLLPPESGVTLEAARPAWSADLSPPRAVGTVVVETSLSGGAGLANGTPVATIRLRDGGGRSVLWVLRAGEGTGEWAARRPDVERTARLKSPPAWISWVAGGFFGQRYRARWTLPTARPWTQVQIALEPGLPQGTGLVLHQVELRGR
jgi:hypothetical protein